MRQTIISLAAVSLLANTLRAAEPPAVAAPQTASVQLADGFDCPVGRDQTKNYYVARGYRVNGHLGEDWNGEGGGDTDLGDPVFSTAHGIVVFAQDYHLGWGNVVIVRHAWLENEKINYCDSLYGHLNEILTHVGDTVSRGQKIGTIGTNHGMYSAHLHFELRKNIAVGMFRSSFPRDLSVYFVPSQFVSTHRTLVGGGRIVAVPVNTFPAEAPPVLAGPREDTPMVTFGRAKIYATPSQGLILNESPAKPAHAVTPIHNGPAFKIDRYEDIRR